MINWVLGLKARVWAGLYIGSIFVFAAIYALLFDLSFQYGTVYRDAQAQQRLFDEVQKIEIAFVDAAAEIGDFPLRFSVQSVEWQPNELKVRSGFNSIDLSFLVELSILPPSEEGRRAFLSALKEIGWKPENGNVFSFGSNVSAQLTLTAFGEDGYSVPLLHIRDSSGVLGSKPFFDSMAVQEHLFEKIFVKTAFQRGIFASPPSEAADTQGVPLLDRRPFLEWTGLIPSGLSSFPTMLYFSAVTTTTLGYGDIVPVTPGARLLVAFQTILGLVLVGLFLNAIAQARNGNGS